MSGLSPRSSWQGPGGERGSAAGHSARPTLPQGKDTIMFHLHVLGAIESQWLGGYTGSEYSNSVMGQWFGNYKRDLKIYLCFVNHPVHPV